MWLSVGGGYTSLVTAYLLKKHDPGLEVAVLEGSYVGFGSSGRNAGMVLHEPHLERIRNGGAESVRFTYGETIRTIDFIEQLTREEDFDRELERTGYLDIALYPVHQKGRLAEKRCTMSLHRTVVSLRPTALQKRLHHPLPIHLDQSQVIRVVDLVVGSDDLSGGDQIIGDVHALDDHGPLLAAKCLGCVQLDESLG